MTRSWSYTTNCSLPDSDTPSIALNAHTNSPCSLGNNTTFATSQLALDLVVQVDCHPIESVWLRNSAVLRETVDWLTKNALTIGIDAVGIPSTSSSDALTSLLLQRLYSFRAWWLTLPLSVPLHVATRTTHSQSLIVESRSTPTGSLSFISLCLNFVSPPPASNASQSQSTSQASSQEGLLTNQLLAPYPTPLHFTLLPILHSGLSKLFQELSKVFPLCFNPIWVDRLTHDLAPFRSIANSLSKILSPSALISGGQMSLDETLRARDLQQDLASLLSPSTSSSLNDKETCPVDDSPTLISHSQAIEKSLLLSANQPHLVDPIKLSHSYACSSTSATRKRGGRGGGGARGRRAKQSRVAPGNLRRSSREKKKKHGGIAEDEAAEENDWRMCGRKRSQSDSHGEPEMEEEVDMLELDTEAAMECVDREEEADEDEEMLLCEEYGGNLEI
ncbi:hypothetical protein JCM3765_005955 [Sporobolomyces pararoseus]